jgi:hypothetical protein
LSDDRSHELDVDLGELMVLATSIEDLVQPRRGSRSDLESFADQYDRSQELVLEIDNGEFKAANRRGNQLENTPTLAVWI